MKKPTKNKIKSEINTNNLEKIKNMYIELVGKEELNKEKTTELNILGTTYTLKIIDDENYRYGSEIHLRNKIITIGKNTGLKTNHLNNKIIHAFLFESGLHTAVNWAENEELIDWFALQLDKIIEVSKKATCYLTEI